ncbi:MAG: bifunctional 3,4-dihydroxy-2-butanone-4-phosphate synthase/GTP cyclohydrolase II, partial [bacterium]|nr:bifunctional 3,4-dihydroxy-2-butanone-4-phosphate synthase/GTP cyclohydrolase II [bacterium]
DLGIKTMRIISNNPRKIHGLGGYGLEIVDRVPLKTGPQEHNARYLDTKREKLGHLLDEYNQPARAAGGR